MLLGVIADVGERHSWCWWNVWLMLVRGMLVLVRGMVGVGEGHGQCWWGAWLVLGTMADVGRGHGWCWWEAWTRLVKGITDVWKTGAQKEPWKEGGLACSLCLRRTALLGNEQQWSVYSQVLEVLGKWLENMSKGATAATLPHSAYEDAILRTTEQRKSQARKKSSSIIFSNLLPLSILSLTALCQRTQHRMTFSPILSSFHSCLSQPTHWGPWRQRECLQLIGYMLNLHGTCWAHSGPSTPIW